MTSPTPFNHAHQVANEWLHQLAEDKAFADPHRGYAALRAVLHQLRDRLTVDEAAHLGAQLPMLIRGIYYEGWKPSIVPTGEHRLDEFLGGIRARLHDHPEIDVDRAARSVFNLLQHRISEGEIDDVKHQLPRDILKLWSSPPQH